MRNYFLSLLLITSSAPLFSESPDLITWNSRRPPPGELERTSDSTPAEPTKPESATPPVSHLKPDQTPVEEPVFHAQIGGSYTYAHISPGGNPSTHGNLGGVQGLFELKTPNRAYGAVVLAWRGGNTEGEGEHRSLNDWNIQERIGYTFGRWNGSQVSPFVGFGLRHFGEKVTSAGNSVTFHYNEFYLPVGCLFEEQIHSILSLGLNFQWMPQVYSTVTITQLKGARWLITRQLANFLVEFPLTITFLAKYHLAVVFEPFFEYWRDGHTTAKTSQGSALSIPRNNYLFAGVNLNILFSF